MGKAPGDDSTVVNDDTEIIVLEERKKATDLPRNVAIALMQAGEVEDHRMTTLASSLRSSPPGELRLKSWLTVPNTVLEAHGLPLPTRPSQDDPDKKNPYDFVVVDKDHSAVSLPLVEVAAQGMSYETAKRRAGSGQNAKTQPAEHGR